MIIPDFDLVSLLSSGSPTSSWPGYYYSCFRFLCYTLQSPCSFLRDQFIFQHNLSFLLVSISFLFFPYLTLSFLASFRHFYSLIFTIFIIYSFFSRFSFSLPVFSFLFIFFLSFFVFLLFFLKHFSMFFLLLKIFYFLLPLEIYSSNILLFRNTYFFYLPFFYPVGFHYFFLIFFHEGAVKWRGSQNKIFT